jgi:hypothetical protein
MVIITGQGRCSVITTGSLSSLAIMGDFKHLRVAEEQQIIMDGVGSRSRYCFYLEGLTAWLFEKMYVATNMFHENMCSQWNRVH